MHRVRVTFIVAVLLSLCGGLFLEELILEDAKDVQVTLISVQGLFSCLHHCHMLFVLRVVYL